MIWLAVVIVIALLVAVVWTLSSPATPEIDPEEATRAAIELHAIERRMDVAETRHELHRDATRLRRELADELRDVD